MVNAINILDPWYFWPRWYDKGLTQFLLSTHHHPPKARLWKLTSLLMRNQRLRKMENKSSLNQHLQGGLTISPVQTSGQSKPGCITQGIGQKTDIPGLPCPIIAEKLSPPVWDREKDPAATIRGPLGQKCKMQPKQGSRNSLPLILISAPHPFLHQPSLLRKG